MAMMDRTRMLRAAGAAGVAAPYVRRLMSDERLRDELRNLIGSATHLYNELSNEKMDKILKDDKIRKDIDSMVESMQKAGQRAMKQRRGTNWFGITLVSGIVGAVVALLVYPRTRHSIQSAVVNVRRGSLHAVEDIQEKAA